MSLGTRANVCMPAPRFETCSSFQALTTLWRPDTESLGTARMSWVASAISAILRRSVCRQGKNARATFPGGRSGARGGTRGGERGAQDAMTRSRQFPGDYLAFTSERLAKSCVSRVSRGVETRSTWREGEMGRRTHMRKHTQTHIHMVRGCKSAYAHTRARVQVHT